MHYSVLPWCLINNTSALVKLMSLSELGDWPLSESMMPYMGYNLIIIENVNIHN